MTQILVVEDEMHLAEGLRFNLEAEGYGVKVVDNGEAALELLQSPESLIDVVVLDVMLPGKDGFSVMSELRQSGQFVPTLMLTARSHPEDILNGFAAGADDYLTKPFTMGELLARLRAALRRAFGSARIEIFQTGDLKVDFNRREVFVGDEQVKLTATEYDLLKVLVHHAGLVRTHYQLIHELWGHTQYHDAVHLLRVTVSNLRRKLVCDPRILRYIVTEPGVGYRLRTDADWIQLRENR
jgi:DNA-binding response OmpR family regulator